MIRLEICFKTSEKPRSEKVKKNARHYFPDKLRNWRYLSTDLLVFLGFSSYNFCITHQNLSIWKSDKKGCCNVPIPQIIEDQNNNKQFFHTNQVCGACRGFLTFQAKYYGMVDFFS